jgi:hypothetical protein
MTHYDKMQAQISKSNEQGIVLLVEAVQYICEVLDSFEKRLAALEANDMAQRSREQ